MQICQDEAAIFSMNFGEVEVEVDPGIGPLLPHPVKTGIGVDPLEKEPIAAARCTTGKRIEGFDALGDDLMQVRAGGITETGTEKIRRTISFFFYRSHYQIIWDRSMNQVGQAFKHGATECRGISQMKDGG